VYISNARAGTRGHSLFPVSMYSQQCATKGVAGAAAAAHDPAASPAANSLHTVALGRAHRSSHRGVRPQVRRRDGPPRPEEPRVLLASRDLHRAEQQRVVADFVREAHLLGLHALPHRVFDRSGDAAAVGDQVRGELLLHLFRQAGGRVTSVKGCVAMLSLQMRI